jgi:two-component system sensor histidine kinase AlgZ
VDAARPLDALWQPRAVVWAVLVAVGLALVLALAPGLPHDRLVYFGLAAMAALWTVMIALGTLYLLRRTLRQMPAMHLAWMGLAVLLLAAWLVGSLAWWLFGELRDGPEQTLAALLANLSGIVLAVGLLSLAAFQNEWRSRRLQWQARQAELDALHARIQPHFLFNTLNTAAALVHERPDQAEDLLLDLADLFRAALSGPRSTELAAEIGLLRRYLEIEKLRLGERLRVHWDLPSPLPAIDVPALCLQPLAENAVRHGIEPRAEGGDLRIRVWHDARALHLAVDNPLAAMTGAAAVQAGHGLGQGAVRARLESAGTGGRLDTRREDERYIAEISLPNAGTAQVATR